MNILCGDIGGTHTRLAVFRSTGHGFEVVEENVYKSSASPTLESVVKQFLDGKRHACGHACFGIAGPVKNGRCEATNLPWIVDASSVAAQTQIEHIHLLNDLEANAYGISALKEDDFVVLNEGAPEAYGNKAIISAGTGLGEAALYWDGQRHHPFASEGGHCDFAPGNALQTRLLDHLNQHYEHVSWERVLSGPGLVNIHAFLCKYRAASPSADMKRQMTDGDPAAVISRAGMSRDSAIANEALNVFALLYGAEAGNLALKVMATGGVYIGGGIAPKIIDKIKEPHFMAGFLNKGRMRKLMTSMPVKVILNNKTALLGTAEYVNRRVSAPSQAEH